MPIKTTGKTILQQLHGLVAQLDETEYNAKLDLLNDNSIGRHVRHIMEFFDILIHENKQGKISYDKRLRSPIHESEAEAALQKLEELIEGLDQLNVDFAVVVEVKYGDDSNEITQLTSSVARELAYNIEHAIHHMAIIKMAVQTVFPRVKLTDDFGVAYSTIRYGKSLLK